MRGEGIGRSRQARRGGWGPPLPPVACWPLAGRWLRPGLLCASSAGFTTASDCAANEGGQLGGSFRPGGLADLSQLRLAGFRLQAVHAGPRLYN